jgi:hypothetical protein
MSQRKPVTWTARSVQYAIALQLDYFRYCIVPNIKLGNSDEMDLAILSPSKILWEVEIKISLNDWRRDLGKSKWTRPASDSTPARFYYAVPGTLVKNGIPSWVPGKAGVLAIYNNRSTKTLSDGSQEVVDRPYANVLRVAKPNHRNRLPEMYVYEMYRKLSVRYWRQKYDRENSQKILLPEE